jgi:hypothetical protein
MKDTIYSILAALNDGTTSVQHPKFSTVGGCIDAIVPVPGSDDIAFQITFERCEILAQLYRDALIKSYDANTRQVLMASDDEPAAKLLYEAYGDLTDSYKAQFHDDLLKAAITAALVILDAEEDAEELFNRFFFDYTYMEKMALLWRLSQQATSNDYHVSQSVQHMLNYMDGYTPTMPMTLDMRYRLFGVWLKNKHGSLFSLCRLVSDNPATYTSTVA